MVSLDDVAGLWTRSVIAFADGRQDATTRVVWLQGRTRFADLRQPAGRPPWSANGLRDLTAAEVAWLATQQGFAGRLSARDGVFTWTRTIDLQPSGQPDLGRMRWEPTATDGRTLIEEALDGAYVERWHGPSAPAEPGLALDLADPESARTAIVLRVGPDVMLARSRAVPLLPGVTLATCVAGAASLAAAQDMVDCEISLGRVEGDGVRITRSTLPFRDGAHLPLPGTGRHYRLDGRPWSVTALEGDAAAA